MSACVFAACVRVSYFLVSSGVVSPLLWCCGGILRPRSANSETQAETVAFLRRVLLRHSQGMQLGGKSILGLPTMTHKVFFFTITPYVCICRYAFEERYGSFTLV